MSATNTHFTIEQGATFTRRWQCRQTHVSGQPLADLTGFTCQAQMRDRPGGNLLAQFDASVDTVTATFSISLAAEVTAALSFTTAFIDVLLISPSAVTRSVQGAATLSPAVTVES